MPHIFEVAELTAAVKDVLESQFPFIWVRGQVGGVTRPPSGHVYFTLKDDRSQVPVVWFKNSRREVKAGEVNPVTGEVMEAGYTPDVEEGMEILVAGRINVYEPRGAYQLVAEFVQEEGVGQLYLQFEALKAKLQAMGYFDEDRKMVLPRSPKRVAVVTAQAGAAIRDFLRIAGERGTGCEIRIYPSLVQGDAAPAQIAEALDSVNEDDWAEIVVLIRGGGSLEDLWAFNTELVADAVFRSRVPVLSGVGHEVDVSIADYVADARAATPSHAAQMLWPERRELAQRIDGVELALMRAGNALLGGADRELSSLERALRLLSPSARVQGMQVGLDRALDGLVRAWDAFAQSRDADLENLQKGLFSAFGPRTVDRARERMDASTRRLELAGGIWLDGLDRRLSLLEGKLGALDPEKPLERGYGLVRSSRTGKFLRSVADAAPGESLDIRVSDGHLSADVTDIREDA